ncbi:hypothetical protein BOO86_05530 [Mycobacterium sp. CBMA 234]|uniref:DUF4129 domain-containing protein n=1 Tax=Mycolicibacterium sp. CBMA 234 TaxID=1918495 RepID=UPI0012DFCD10|nr:DUF4129 domain-containing protein [Mycolicibacterium sp. CBMA 234]MUL63919.1 hypothetical protein [Mycolicibacterium sp. CBMA 234]
MNGIDKALGRVVALIALLFFVAIALRGYLPGGDHPDTKAPTPGTASLVGVDTLVIVSVVIVAIGFISSLRHPRTASASAPFRLPGSFDGKVRWRVRRLLLIGLGAFLVWVAILFLVSHLQLLQLPDLPVSVPPPSGAPITAVPSPPSPPPPPAQPLQPGHSVFGYFLAATAVLLLLWVAGGIAVRRSRRVAAPLRPAGGGFEPAISATTPEFLTRAAEFGLAEIGDRSRGPRESIIACYAAMERALADAPGAAPQDSDTPSEVLARAVEHHALHAGSATELVALFAEARFSPHVMTERHREVAADALLRVLAELRSLT